MLTYPLIGNYGVPKQTKDELGLPKFFESEKIHAAGLVVGNYCENYSHWNADETLSQWLVKSDVPAISGIDTRKLTKILREKGSMLAKVIYYILLASFLSKFYRLFQNLFEKKSYSLTLKYRLFSARKRFPTQTALIWSI